MKNPREMLAAGLGGGVGSVFDFLALVILVEYSSASIPVSAFLAAGVGAVVCFVMNKYIAFKDHSPVSLEQIARFGMVAAATALLTAFGMKLVAVDHGVAYPLAKAVCAVAVFIAWTYPAQHRLVFRRAIPLIPV